nr:GPCR kinase [Tanacetum cinerariifolium]
EAGYGKDITVGAAMILKNVSVFTPKPSENYLNITMRNVVEVFRKDTVLESGTGTISGTIHHKVIDEAGYGKDITVGAAMILKNVSVFTPKPSEHYLNITMRNVVEVFRKDTILGSGTG